MKNIFPALRFLLFLSIGAALFYLALRETDLKKMMTELKHAHYSFVFISLVFAMIAFASRAYRWNMLIHPLGYKPKFSSAFYSLMFGYLANLALPRLGEVSRAVALNRAEKIPLDAIIGTVIAERAIDLLMLFLCIVLALIVQFDRIYSFLNDNLIQPLAGKISNTFHSPAFMPVVIGAVIILSLGIFMLRKRKFSSTLAEKTNQFFKGIWQGLLTVIKLKSHSAFIFHTVLIWFLYWLVSYICFFSLNATSVLDMKAGIFVLVVGGLGMTAPVQGGIGAYHWIVTQGLLMFGIEATDGLSYATLVHTSQTLLVILVGAISFLMLSVFNKKSPRANA
ncbi:MAG TPA: lysylphosphatidylglycerol synthase transmembrane domain-containing protein [Bacteroidia bacterium]|nr:lysylphosphatidylglycerol synthase transmembrane domain-containing protein [Bacteroidia bacterium]